MLKAEGEEESHSKNWWIMNRLELMEEDAQERNLWKKEITVKIIILGWRKNYGNVGKFPNKKKLFLL